MILARSAAVPATALAFLSVLHAAEPARALTPPASPGYRSFMSQNRLVGNITVTCSVERTFAATSVRSFVRTDTSAICHASSAYPAPKLYLEGRKDARGSAPSCARFQPQQIADQRAEDHKVLGYTKGSNYSNWDGIPKPCRPPDTAKATGEYLTEEHRARHDFLAAMRRAKVKPGVRGQIIALLSSAASMQVGSQPCQRRQ